MHENDSRAVCIRRRTLKTRLLGMDLSQKNVAGMNTLTTFSFVYIFSGAFIPNTSNPFLNTI